jgi:hypothetical protein
MVYLANAWNSANVQEIDYVTDPAGREQMDSMAAQMVNLRFDHCSQNPAGDFTCYFTHDIAASDDSTTYPNPMNYCPWPVSSPRFWPPDVRTPRGDVQL